MVFIHVVLSVQLSSNNIIGGCAKSLTACALIGMVLLVALFAFTFLLHIGKEFWSRSGTVITLVPPSFKSGLPNIGMDGEFW